MRRIALGALGVVAGVAVLSACGSSNVPGQASGQAQAQAVQPKSVTDLAHLVSLQTSTKHTVHIQFDATSSAGSFTGTGQADLAGTDSRMSMNMQSPVGELDMVLAGSALYLKAPAVLHSAKPWVKVDANGTDEASKAVAALVSQEQQTADPSKALQQISSAGTIDQVTPDQVNGQPATRYRITVNTQKLLNSNFISPQMRQLLESAQAVSKLPPSMTYDVWISADNLPAKMDLTEDLTVQGKKVDVSIVMTYSDWGAPVTITVPSPAEVGPLPSR